MSSLIFDAELNTERLQRDLKKVNTSFKNFASGTQKDLGKIDTSFLKIGSTLQTLVPVASFATAGLMMERLVSQTYRFADDLSLAMREVETISQAVQEDFKGMEDAIVNLAATGPDSAIELAKAFYQIVSAGYDGAAGLELLRVSSEAATAGITDTKTAADGLTTILNAWGKDADEAGKVADVMFKTVEKGKTTFGEIASSISQVAPIASAMGISFEEVSAALASLTKQGTTTPMAITQIRQAILSTNEVLGDGWSKAMTFQEGLQAIRDMSGGSATKLQELMGRVEGVTAVLALTGEKAAAAADDLNAMTTATGAMQSAYDKMMLEASNKWSMVHNKWNRELKSIGDLLKSGSVDIATKINELLTDNEEDIIKPGAAKAIQDFNTELDNLTDKEDQLALITNRIIEMRNATDKLRKEENKLEDERPGYWERNNEKLWGAFGFRQRGYENEAMTENVQNDIKINERVLQELAQLYQQVLKGPEVEIQVDENNKAATKSAKTLADALANIKKLQADLGKGTIEQDVQIYLKIANEQQFIDQTAQQVREAFEKAINESWQTPFNRTVGVDGTNATIETIDNASDLISGQTEAYKEQTQEISKQLKPMKRLTDEEKRQLEAEAKKLDMQQKLQDEYEKTAKMVMYTGQILDAASQITTEYGEQLGLSKEQSEVLSRSLSAMSGIARIASGDIVGGAAQLTSSALDLFLTAPEKLSERYEQLNEQINKIIESANIANETLGNIGLNGALPALLIIQSKLTGLLNDAKKLNAKFKDNERYGNRNGDEGTNIFRTGNYNYVRQQLDLVNTEMERLARILLSGGISEEQRKAIEALLGTYNQLISQMDAITQDFMGTTVNDLADSLVEAFLAGEDAAEAWGDKLDGIIKKILVDQLSAKLLVKPFQNATDLLIKNSEDGLTPAEMKLYTDAVEEAMAAAQPAIDATKKAWENLGFDFSDISAGYSELQGISRSITEETGSLLVGQVMSVREYQVRSHDILKTQLESMDLSLSVLNDIKKNTSHNFKLNEIAETALETNRILKEKL